MDQSKLKIKQPKTGIITAAATALVIACFSPFIYKAVKNYVTYDCAHSIERQIGKGDTITKYFNAENTSKNLKFEDYQNALERLNEGNYVKRNGFEGILSNPNNLPEGKIISLLDVNKDGYVGIPKK